MWWNRILPARRATPQPGAQAAPPARREAGPVLFDDALVRRLDRLVLRLNRQLHGRPGGERTSRKRIPSADIGDHRAYAAGDDLRHVDWHTYARHDQLVVRLGSTSQSVPVQVVLDRSRSMAWGDTKWRAAQRLAGALGYLALATGDRLSVATFGQTLEPLLGPLQGKKHAPELFARVADVAAAQRTALQPVVEGLKRQSLQSGLFVLISDFLSDDDPAACLATLGGPQRELLVVHLLDERELDPAARGAVDLEDYETGERLSIQLDAAALEEYHARLQAWSEAIASAVQQRGGAYAQVQCGWPLERQVIPYLRRRGLLA